jgi:FHA domain-containing protein
MSRAQEPMRLSESDLFAPQVDAYLEAQKIQRRDIAETEERSWYEKIFYSSYFYLSLAGGLGAFLAWAAIEPFFDDAAVAEEEFNAGGFLLFPCMSAGVGLFLGSAEGMICRNLRRALLCASIGLGVGFVGGVASLLVAGIVFLIMSAVALAFSKNPQQNAMPTGIAFLILMMGRAAAWAIAAIPAGIGQGIALRDRKVVVNGLLGGVLGGLLGGILFDPISVMFTDVNGDASLSRAVGLTIIGLMVGFFVGVVEQWTKTAWLLMRTGPLAGKQFILYRNPTVIGSSPRADVYLFKDQAIEPRHALIHNRGGRYEIEDQDSADGVYVNGSLTRRRVLQPGDKIVLGKTVLEFAMRDAD